MKKIGGILILVFLLVMVGLVSAIDITNCQTLDQAGETYELLDNATTTGTCFNITANNVTLDLNGFTIGGAEDGFGVNIIDRYNITIKNGQISNFTRAIHLENTTTSLLWNNTISSNEGIYSGIFLTNSSSNNITGSRFNDNNASYNSGLYLNESNNNLIARNVFDDNDVLRSGHIYAAGILGLYASENNIISDNNLTSNSVETTGTQDIYGGGILGLYQSPNNNITFTQITDNFVSSNEIIGAGLLGLYQSSGSNVISTQILNNNIITRSNDVAGGGAFGLYSSSNNNILSTIITNNTLFSGWRFLGGGAFGLWSSSNNNITSTTIINNSISSDYWTAGGGAFGLYSSSNNNISSTQITNNTISLFDVEGGGGLGLDSYSDNNIFDGCNILGNLISIGGALGLHREVQDNTFINLNATSDNVGFVIRDESTSRTNYLIYNNFYGEIKWINSNFLEDLDIKNNITFEVDVIIGKNTAYLNSSHFLTEGSINSSANVTLRNTGVAGDYKIMKNGVVCTDCTMLENDTATGTYKFNVTSWSNYSISGCGDGNVDPGETYSNCPADVDAPSDSGDTQSSPIGGGGYTETCGEWSACTDGTKTQNCNNGSIIKTRTCTSEENNESGSDEVLGEITGETTEGTTEETSEETLFSAITRAGRVAQAGMALLLILVIVGLYFLVSYFRKRA